MFTTRSLRAMTLLVVVVGVACGADPGKSPDSIQLHSTPRTEDATLPGTPASENSTPPPKEPPPASNTSAPTHGASPAPTARTLRH